ncbi:uncharacterized protein ASCRUDRAFT_80940 [Ascoidea rubescens DSM 1968]|uniref:Uncharacterized protein n=1 Tax=Ascoidea rubescens DSM 1968 TaxID=1344418 RepID=A0A1D2VHS3_9ASCO|nr:hypothetical protein ASCRUDRAFT_80940 [Ascoidea rubescens DSM 1968]ODV61198.1 hypothetical protein ASCRUDRAFT_80940 [Ascoidea rubescens DSM 1968]
MVEKAVSSFARGYVHPQMLNANLKFGETGAMLKDELAAKITELKFFAAQKFCCVWTVFG